MDVGHKEQRNDHSEPNNRLIVNNLKFETDENGLRDYFSKFGQVLSVEIPLSQNKSRGFGFVTFSTVEEATKANDPNVTHEINERQVRTSFAKKRENVVREERKVRKLYIGKLPKEINEEELKQYFGQFGKVEETILSTFQFAPLLNGYPQHRGYGFVKFESDEDASKAVKQKEHVIKGTTVFLKKAVDDKPKDRKNKNNNNDRKNNDRKNNNNKGGNRERRNNKEGGNNNKSQSPSTNSSSPSTTQSTNTTSPSTTTATTTSPSTTTATTTSPSTTTESGSQEKKSVVVKRKEDSPSTNSKQSTPKTDNRRQQSNNNNKSNNTQTTTKKAVIIQNTSSSTVNPWKKTNTTATETQPSNEYPSLSSNKKKTNNNTKKSPTTTTTVDNGKEDKEDK